MSAPKFVCASMFVPSASTFSVNVTCPYIPQSRSVNAVTSLCSPGSRSMYSSLNVICFGFMSSGVVAYILYVSACCPLFVISNRYCDGEQGQVSYVVLVIGVILTFAQFDTLIVCVICFSRSNIVLNFVVRL